MSVHSTLTRKRFQDLLPLTTHCPSWHFLQFGLGAVTVQAAVGSRLPWRWLGAGPEAQGLRLLASTSSLNADYFNPRHRTHELNYSWHPSCGCFSDNDYLMNFKFITPRHVFFRLGCWEPILEPCDLRFEVGYSRFNFSCTFYACRPYCPPCVKVETERRPTVEAIPSRYYLRGNTVFRASTSTEVNRVLSCFDYGPRMPGFFVFDKDR